MLLAEGWRLGAVVGRSAEPYLAVCRGVTCKMVIIFLLFAFAEVLFKTRSNTLLTRSRPRGAGGPDRVVQEVQTA